MPRPSISTYSHHWQVNRSHRALGEYVSAAAKLFGAANETELLMNGHYRRRPIEALFISPINFVHVSRRSRHLQYRQRQMPRRRAGRATMPLDAGEHALIAAIAYGAARYGAAAATVVCDHDGKIPRYVIFSSGTGNTDVSIVDAARQLRCATVSAIIKRISRPSLWAEQASITRRRSITIIHAMG